MRHINPEQVYERIPNEWHRKATEALERIRSLPAEKRSEEINNLSHIWTMLKDKLYKVSYGKCWYCETRDVRHDDEVDHWRPKNAVSECKEHEGYWWLAFKWENYRYSCAHCNQIRTKDKSGRSDRGGKSTTFPLLNERDRIFSECHLLALRQEKPVLLDPTILQDTYLLKFDVDGVIYPAKKAPSIQYERAEKSITTYHLNAYDLVEKRRTTVCNHVERLLQDGEGYLYCIKQSSNDFAAQAGYERVVNQLAKMLSEKAEYSMTARSILYLHRKEFPWVEEILGINEAS